MRDLFGEVPKSKRKGTKPNGYAWRPGTGPKGETCGSCEHCVKRAFTAGSYFKCKLNEVAWGHTRRTDILFRSAACKYWEKDNEPDE